MPERHKRKHLTSFQMIILGFAGVILLGALLLMLPVSSAERVVTPFDQALFTSTSAVCVTGLVVQDTGSYWSGFGQAVILLLIQTGRPGSCNGCRFGVYAVRTKDITDAAKYHAGCHLSTKSRWYCPPDKVYSERNVSDRRNWCGFASSGILP